MQPHITQEKETTVPISSLGGSNPLMSGFAKLFKAIVKARNRAFDRFSFLSYQAERPVISIGGIRAGGTGKTPVTLFVGEYLMNKGYDLAFLSRGYGRKSKECVLLSPAEQSEWDRIGDEPALIHANIPASWMGIGAQRVKSAKKLLSQLPLKSAYILDDGFQHRKIRRDLDIVCVHEGVFEDRMIPAGFLREPLESLHRAGLVVVIGSEDSVDKLKRVRDELNLKFPTTPCSLIFQKPLYWVEANSGRKSEGAPLQDPWVICAIARPQRFISTVKSYGITPSGVQCFRDHHVFQSDDLTAMQDIYSKGIVTTEKDFMRLKTLQIANSVKVWYLKIGLQFVDEKSEKSFESAINRSLP